MREIEIPTGQSADRALADALQRLGAGVDMELTTRTDGTPVIRVHEKGER